MRAPVWEEVPLGLVKKRDHTGGTKYAQRRTRPTGQEVKRGRPVGDNFNLVFVHGGQRAARTYELTFTSIVDRAKTFRVRVAASSLQGLLRDTVKAIGNLRSPQCCENFTLHYELVSTKPGMSEEIIHVPYAEELPGALTNNTLEEPITVED